MTETTIAVGADTVWADDSGGDLPPLILLHPGVGDSRIWEPVLPALTATNRVIRYDTRGYGRSPAATEAFSLVDDLITVLDHYELGRVPIVGSSQGGGAAAALAVTAPERVSALVLLCPGFTGFEPPDDPAVAAEFEKAAADGVDGMASLCLRLWGRAGSTPAVMEQVWSGANAWLANGELMNGGPAVFDRLEEIVVPTSLLVGDLDQEWIIQSNLDAARRIPGCVLEFVEGVDHLPTLRVPEKVLHLIRMTIPT
jgi:3-oxoadipate enol-lactonase